jgi:hypothetical protein
MSWNREYRPGRNHFVTEKKHFVTGVAVSDWRIAEGAGRDPGKQKNSPRDYSLTSNESSIERTTTTEVNCRIDGYFCEALSGRVQRYWRQSLGVLWFLCPKPERADG